MLSATGEPSGSFRPKTTNPHNRALAAPPSTPLPSHPVARRSNPRPAATAVTFQPIIPSTHYCTAPTKLFPCTRACAQVFPPQAGSTPPRSLCTPTP
eukprot:324458-Chlamydomonas_euryale.AAC.1